VLAVSAASLIIKAAQGEGAPSLIIAAGRLTLAALILIPISLARHRAELLALNRRDLFWAAATGVCLGLHFAAWITSLEYTTIASSVVLVSTAPLFVGLFSMLVWREQLGRPLMIGLFVAVLGGAIIGLADACAITPDGIHCALSESVQGRAMIGDLLALGGALAMAGYLLIGRRLRAKLSLIPYITLGYSAAALTLILAASLARTSFFGYSLAAYGWIALLGLGPQLIGHSSFNWALRYLSATYVSVTVLGEPIGSTILAFIILRQTPAPLVLFGGALILGGILLASRR
jgi:drug/metabolite transporter (DMT)-like permease